MADGAPSGYEIAAAASGDHGFEGFSVELGGARIGRVAAVNRMPDGLSVMTAAFVLAISPRAR